MGNTGIGSMVNIQIISVSLTIRALLRKLQKLMILTDLNNNAKNCVLLATLDNVGWQSRRIRMTRICAKEIISSGSMAWKKSQVRVGRELQNAQTNIQLLCQYSVALKSLSIGFFISYVSRQYCQNSCNICLSFSIPQILLSQY